MSSTRSRSRPCISSPNAKTEASTTPAAPGLGMPVKYRLSAVGSIVVLNRASRIAAQATHSPHTTQPIGSQPSRPSENSVKAISAGAMPKDTRSARESNCRPKGVTAPTSRATAPSVMSKTIEKPISTAASVWSPRIDTRIAAKPHIMLASVNRLGRVASARRRVPRTDPRTNSTVAVRRVCGRRAPDAELGTGASSASVGPAGDDGLAAAHPLAHPDEHRAVPGDEHVHAGPELHQAHPLTGRQLPADAGAGDDAAGEQGHAMTETHPQVSLAHPKPAAHVAACLLPQ